MLRILSVPALIWLLVGCSPEPDKPQPPAAPQVTSPATPGVTAPAAPEVTTPGAPQASAPQTPTAPATPPAAQPDAGAGSAIGTLQVYKSPTCGCCAYWVEHMEKSNFKLKVTDLDTLAELKQRLGIARELQSCHTTQTADGRYFFEGHVPAPVVAKFLASPPANALGLAVPAMPIGSPGMEMDDRFQPYDVLVVYENGSTAVYARMENQAQQYN